MSKDYQTPRIIPQIRNIEDIGDEIEPTMFLHFTGEQWKSAIQDVRMLRDADQLPVRFDGAGGLRFRFLGRRRGDVLVWAHEREGCFGAGGIDEVCIPVAVPGRLFTFRCVCFELEDKDNRPIEEEERKGTCTVGFDPNDDWKVKCVAHDCDRCVPLGYQGRYSGFLNCYCMENLLVDIAG